MKVAIVLNTSWNIYNFRFNFVKTLLSRGYEVHTVAPTDDFTHFLTEAGCIHHPVRMDSRGINPVKDLALLVELWSIYRKINPDIILHYTIKPNVYGSLAASFLKIPVVNNVCGLGTVFLKKNLPGIDLKKFTPSAFHRNKPFTFLLISRLITDKGIMEYVEAVEKLKAEGIEARFQILGAKDPLHQRGIALEVIDGWIASHTIEYLGTTKDVRPFINAADCIVLPSYREGTPHTLLEAASCAKPIIATDVPGCHQVVKDQYNGLLCKLRDADDLALKMKQMANLNDQTLRQFGENGRKKMESEFNEDVVINKYLSTLTELRPATVAHAN